MRDELERIKQKFSGKLIGNSRMQYLVCEVLSHLPEKVVDEITENCWFVSSFDDAWGFTIQGKELGGKHLIFLSEELFSQDKKQQFYTVAHEIGHVVLNHRNAILEPQSSQETVKQEKEAHAFVKENLELNQF